MANQDVIKELRDELAGFLDAHIDRIKEIFDNPEEFIMPFIEDFVVVLSIRDSADNGWTVAQLHSANGRHRDAGLLRWALRDYEDD